MLNLDFSSVPSREALDEGVYSLIVSEAEETTSSSGNPMISLTFDVQGVDGNRKIWDNLVLIDKCMWKVKEFFAAIGVDVSSVVTIDVVELIGMSVNAKIIKTVYQGEDKNEVKKYMQSA